MILVPFIALYNKFWGPPPKPSATKRIYARRSPVPKPDIFDAIMREASGIFGVPIEGLISSRRDAETALARHVVCYLAYKQTGLSLPAIGRLLGNRDHTTILHAVRRIEKLLEAGDEDLAVAIITITRRVK